MIGGVTYQKIDDQGLHMLQDGEPLVLAVDTIIICAGQVSERKVFEELKERIPNVHIIGGADVAMEIDAKLAIDQGCRLAAVI